MISAVPSSNPTFLARNFTDAEIAYCRSQPSPEASFAARWTGKEAVFKSLGVSSKGAAAAMKDIEILPNEAGAPTVTLHGDAKDAADGKGITTIHISLSHSEVCYFFPTYNAISPLTSSFRLLLSLSLKLFAHNHLYIFTDSLHIHFFLALGSFHALHVYAYSYLCFYVS